MDTYSRYARHLEPAAVTGKPLLLGGLASRREATGRGVALCALKTLGHLGLPSKGARVVVQGFGNVGSVAARLLACQGCKIIGISDVTGGHVSEKGIDIDSAIAYVQENNSLAGFKGADTIDGHQLLELSCDLLCPCAIGDQITAENAPRVKARAIVEGANGPTSSLADATLEEAGVFVVPDILANAGGVTVSYFEWVQNRMGYRWPEKEVNERLEHVIREAFESVLNLSELYGVNMRLAAYCLGISRVAETLELRGVW